MRTISYLMLAFWLASTGGARALPASVPLSPLTAPQFQPLLQKFVNGFYRRAFRHLGDERDFDHGHVLFDARSGKPFAILYHTQEMAQDYAPGNDFGYIDKNGRNWIQWIGRNEIKNADCCVLKEFPKSAYWDWFKMAKLPGLKERFTILDTMLDPASLGVEISRSVQQEFTRVSCGAADGRPSGSSMNIVLPTGEKVCLALVSS